MIAKRINLMMKLVFSSIRTKGLIIFAILVALISGFIFMYFPRALEIQSLRAVSIKARTIAEMSSFGIASALFFDDAQAIEEVFRNARQNKDVRYLVVQDSLGKTLWAYQGPVAIEANYLDALSNNQISADGTIYRDVASIVLNGKLIGTLFLGLSLEDVQNEVRQSKAAVAAISLVIFILGMVVVVWSTRVLTTPLREITRTAMRVSKGDLSQRVSVNTIDEVGDLAVSFNRMIEHVERRTLQLQAEIDQRIAAESTIRDQAALLNVTKDAILVCDLDFRITFWNSGAEALYGWTSAEVAGRTLGSSLLNPDGALAEASRELFEKGEWEGEVRYINKGGAPIIVESRWRIVYDHDGTPKSVFITDADVTEKRNLEARFLRAQRMESVGTLAAGIAHDLNNVLTPILLSVDLLKRRLTDPAGQAMLTMVQASATRGAGIIKQILSFARGFEGEKTTVQLRHLLKEFEKMARDTFPRSIDIRVECPRDSWMVSGDPTQLYQVLMNLCVNSRDAMSEGGTLKISLENLLVDEAYARLHTDATPGPYVALTVSDTGTGIPHDIIEKIFDPFFTTKDVGQGTGLGLSTVMGIIKGHGGFVNVYSEVGSGTRFKIHIPALDTQEAQQTENEEPELPRGDGKVVLVVDDEAIICEMQKEALEAYGYRVLTAHDGTEAVSIVARRDGEIHAVVTDMMMPYLDGPATIRALKKIDPSLKFIAVSGMNGDTKMSEIDGSIQFLLKPFTTETLLLALDETLRN